MKTFIISNSSFYVDFEKLLGSNLWYKNESVLEVYILFSELILLSKKRKQVKEQMEVVEVNNKIKRVMTELGGII